MTDAEQFLANLEAKAKAATLEEWREGIAILPDGSIVPAVVTADGDEICNTGQSLLRDVFDAAFIAAATPPAVLRLVGMVRWLADNFQRHTCPDQSLSCEVGCPQCIISAAYAARKAVEPENDGGWA